jgi:hypothetical protein
MTKIEQQAFDAYVEVLREALKTGGMNEVAVASKAFADLARATFAQGQLGQIEQPRVNETLIDRVAQWAPAALYVMQQEAAKKQQQ